MNCLYDIYTKGNAMQCSGMGYFIVHPLRALFSPQCIFREILIFILTVIVVFVVYYLPLVVVNCWWWKYSRGFQHWTEILLSLCHQLRTLHWRPGNGPAHWAQRPRPALCRSSGLPGTAESCGGGSFTPLWLICKVVLYSMQWVEAMTQWPKLLLFLYMFKILYPTAVRDSHRPPFLPASLLCLPNDMSKKERVGTFLLDNSFLNRQTDKVWNRSHIAFCLHRSKVPISDLEDRMSHQGLNAQVSAVTWAGAMGRKREAQLKAVFTK